MARDRANLLYVLDMPWPVAVLAALSACLFFSLAGARVVYKPYRIPSGSMQPTLQVGDYFMADKFAYRGGRTVQRGDIVVVRGPDGSQQDFVDRVVGLPGDRVQLIGGVVHINGVAAPMRTLGARDFTDQSGQVVRVEAFEEVLPDAGPHLIVSRDEGPGDDTQVYDVPTGEMFLLGDDRDNSSDSRFEMGGFGCVPQSKIVGMLVFTIALPRR